MHRSEHVALSEEPVPSPVEPSDVQPIMEESLVKQDETA